MFYVAQYARHDLPARECGAIGIHGVFAARTTHDVCGGAGMHHLNGT
jgi:hypothetical protein